VRASKVGLLLLILAFGGVVETAWFVENRFDVGPSGCRAMGWRPYGPSFSFESQERHPLAAGTAVELENSFGAVRVKKGEPGEVHVSMRKVVFRRTEAEARAYADRIRLNAVTQPGALRLSTNRQELEKERGRDGVGFETHLEVTVPPDTAVKVQNEHGEVELVDVARADVTSSFESVRVERVAGPVTVDARHGDVEVAEVIGDLTVTNRHGGVEARDVQGNTRVQSEHGDVSVTNVGGAAVTASHGDVHVQTVRGDLEVNAQHAGVTVAEVEGKATLETSFQSIEAREIAGEVRLKVEHGGVELEEVLGPAHIEASFGDVKLVRVAGPVEASVEHGGLHAEGVERGAKVRASGGEVVLDGFAGPVDVDVERAGARLVPSGPLGAPVVARTRHGDIALEVPAGSRMSLEATASNGEIDMEVPGFAAEQTADEHGTDRVTGRLGDGSHAVRLTTDHGSVRVTTPTAVAHQP
jgi:DUF4097 and DUF4098 domain-containing protein YvlB